jgi:proteic killer suppression protein
MQHVLNNALVIEAVAHDPIRCLVLKGDRAGSYSIRVNQQWRICFNWSDAGAEDVELIDYH